MLGERLTTLLSLISQDEYKTVDEFAQKMSLSTKTVRGLLQELNEQLQTHVRRSCTSGEKATA